MTPETSNASELVKLLLEAEKPHHKATLPLLNYSTRSLGDALSSLENELMPSVVTAKQGKTSLAVASMTHHILQGEYIRCFKPL